MQTGFCFTVFVAHDIPFKKQGLSWPTEAFVEQTA